MDCYYYYSSSFTSKVVAAVLTILLLTVEQSAVFQDVTGCGPIAAASTGACSSDYASCLTTVIDLLASQTPVTASYSYSTSYPTPDSPGGVAGTATCGYDYAVTACTSCLGEAVKWLKSNCISIASRYGVYSRAVCTMSYAQIEIA